MFGSLDSVGLSGADDRSVPRKRILIVDDNQDAADLLAEAVSSLGHEVAIARDGPTALAAAQAFHPEIALLDLGLPVMDGYELARRLRALGRPELRLVAITGYGQDSDRRRSLEAGFEQHLVKPLDLGYLERLLAGHP
jgi:CheY-like chemotaxis protein